MSLRCNTQLTVFFFNKRDFDPWVKSYATVIENSVLLFCLVGLFLLILVLNFLLYESALFLCVPFVMLLQFVKGVNSESWYWWRQSQPEST